MHDVIAESDYVNFSRTEVYELFYGDVSYIYAAAFRRAGYIHLFLSRRYYALFREST